MIYDPANDNQIPLIDGRQLAASLDRLDQYLEEFKASIGTLPLNKP